MAKPEIDDSFDEESDIEAFLERRDNVDSQVEDCILNGDDDEADFE